MNSTKLFNYAFLPKKIKIISLWWRPPSDGAFICHLLISVLESDHQRVRCGAELFSVSCSENPTKNIEKVEPVQVQRVITPMDGHKNIYLLLSSSDC